MARKTKTVQAVIPSTGKSSPGTPDSSEADHSSDTLSDQSPFFYPGLYCPSGFDLMKILYYVAVRPFPSIDLGPVDASCPIVLCDLLLPDTPVVYVSEPFLDVTGYAMEEVLGRNCRFLQSPPLPTLASSSTLDIPTSNCSISPSYNNSSTYTPSTATPSSSSSSSAPLSPMPSSVAHHDVVPSHIRQLLRQSVAQNKEVQVALTNFRRDGSAFVNFMSLVPISWDDDSSCYDYGRDNGSRTFYDTQQQQQRQHRYSVGFICDVSGMTST